MVVLKLISLIALTDFSSVVSHAPMLLSSPSALSMRSPSLERVLEVVTFSLPYFACGAFLFPAFSVQPPADGLAAHSGEFHNLCGGGPFHVEVLRHRFLLCLLEFAIYLEISCLQWQSCEVWCGARKRRNASHTVTKRLHT